MSPSVAAPTGPPGILTCSAIGSMSANPKIVISAGMPRKNSIHTVAAQRKGGMLLSFISARMIARMRPPANDSIVNSSVFLSPTVMMPGSIFSATSGFANCLATVAQSVANTAHTTSAMITA